MPSSRWSIMCAIIVGVSSAEIRTGVVIFTMPRAIDEYDLV